MRNARSTRTTEAILTLVVVCAGAFIWIFRGGVQTYMEIADNLFQPWPAYHLIVEFKNLKPATRVFALNEPELGGDIANEVAGLHLTGRAGDGSAGVEFEPRDGLPLVRVLLLATGPVLQNATLRLPQTGSVVYVLRNGRWEAHAQQISGWATQRIRITADPANNGSFRAIVTGFHRWTQSHPDIQYTVAQTQESITQ